VNTASLTALMSFRNLGSLAHTIAKAGTIGMTRQLAMEEREHRNGRVTCGRRPQKDEFAALAAKRKKRRWRSPTSAKRRQ
jgi:hypothetical protein